MPWLDFERGACFDPVEMNGYMEGACAMALEDTAVWKPLVLLIPLRLGLSDINEAYIETLKVNEWKKKSSTFFFSTSLFHSVSKLLCLEVSMLVFLSSTAMLYDASVFRGDWWEAKQCPLLYRVCW